VIAIEDAMGQLIVRGLDDTLIQALKQWAAKRRRSG
jgi:plasmid stability protein